MRRRLTPVLLIAIAVGLLAGVSAAAGRSKGAPMTEQEAISQALQDRGMTTKTANDATSPREPGSPDFLYQAVDLPSGGAIVASGVPYYVAAELTAAYVDHYITVPLPVGSIVIDAKVVTREGFDGTVTGLSLEDGANNVLGGGIRVAFASADLTINNLGGSPVSGLIPFGDPVPQFLPHVILDGRLIFAALVYDPGDPPTTGTVDVILTVIPPLP